jgi:hypothetical protein
MEIQNTINDMIQQMTQYQYDSDCLNERYNSICKSIDDCLKYQKGKIYKIKSDNTDKVYIGSTYTSLTTRLKNHRRQYSYYLNNPNKKLRLSSFDIMELGDYRIELIETYPCYSRKELHKREGYHITHTKNSINKNIAGRCLQQYRHDRKEHIRIAKKKNGQEYYLKNKGIIQHRKRTHYLKNVERYKQKSRDYYLNNRDRCIAAFKRNAEQNKDTIRKYRKRTYICECGSVSVIIQKNRHEKSKKHINFMNNTKKSSLFSIV